MLCYMTEKFQNLCAKRSIIQTQKYLTTSLDKYTKDNQQGFLEVVLKNQKYLLEPLVLSFLVGSQRFILVTYPVLKKAILSLSLFLNELFDFYFLKTRPLVSEDTWLFF